MSFYSIFFLNDSFSCSRRERSRPPSHISDSVHSAAYYQLHNVPATRRERGRAARAALRHAPAAGPRGPPAAAGPRRVVPARGHRGTPAGRHGGARPTRYHGNAVERFYKKPRLQVSFFLFNFEIDM